MKKIRICEYDGCRMEAERHSTYCKYHIRMVESYKKMPPELKEVYKRIKKERYG
ncbi:hypothetical protein [Senegalia sp. (in: firmicutes)]|uniref:hypothetical protein n=1 Tax=Senegalia sp. (in: firmicutes) TaxID=1924098 RepID=UPI003F9DB400